MGDVIIMTDAAKLIREAREAREKRKAERGDRWEELHRPQHPGGIDDMEIG